MKKPFKLIFILCLLVGTNCIGQLDSISVTASFDSNTSIAAGMDSLISGSIQVEVWMNDPTSFGEIVIDIYEHSTNQLVTEAFYTKNQLVNGGHINGNLLDVSVDGLFPETIYRLMVQVRDADRNNLPFIELLVE